MHVVIIAVFYAFSVYHFGPIDQNLSWDFFKIPWLGLPFWTGQLKFPDSVYNFCSIDRTFSQFCALISSKTAYHLISVYRFCIVLLLLHLSRFASYVGFALISHNWISHFTCFIPTYMVFLLGLSFAASISFLRMYLLVSCFYECFEVLFSSIRTAMLTVWSSIELRRDDPADIPSR